MPNAHLKRCCSIISSTWKYPVPIVMDSLTINFKLYTLDETRLNFKIQSMTLNLYQKWSIFDDQYLDLYHSYREVTHITGKLSPCFRISILRLNWSDTRNIIKIAHFRGQRTTVWLIGGTKSDLWTHKILRLIKAQNKGCRGGTHQTKCAKEF